VSPLACLILGPIGGQQEEVEWLPLATVTWQHLQCTAALNACAEQQEEEERLHLATVTWQHLQYRAALNACAEQQEEEERLHLADVTTYNMQLRSMHLQGCSTQICTSECPHLQTDPQCI